MPRLFPVTARRMIQFLEREGFVLVRTKGSHHIHEHGDGRRTVVPVHSGQDLRQSLIKDILRDIVVLRAQRVRQQSVLLWCDIEMLNDIFLQKIS